MIFLLFYLICFWSIDSHEQVILLKRWPSLCWMMMVVQSNCDLLLFILPSSVLFVDFIFNNSVRQAWRPSSELWSSRWRNSLMWWSSPSSVWASSLLLACSSSWETCDRNVSAAQHIASITACLPTSPSFVTTRPGIPWRSSSMKKVRINGRSQSFYMSPHILMWIWQIIC